MMRSSDIEAREGGGDRMFDRVTREIVEGARDWRRLDLRRPGDDRKWGRVE